MITIKNARIYIRLDGNVDVTYKLHQIEPVSSIVTIRKESSAIFEPYEQQKKKSFKDILDEEIKKQNNNSTARSK